ncbi:AraC family transcriptional regulator [Pseudoclavibacter endophyticus]|uniref:HTH-type transcriptional regulator RipA n=2 Tax=Pseudoclavibacter endophyticus TaxID=1778590 RepID=A0A6H9WVG1_9MICO|nr:AraC family transcriptional regulator [Pseudoclavibacter endophyticus]
MMSGMASTRRDRARSVPDVRALPRYTAGELDVPWSIGTFGERLARAAYWPEHSHPTHELIRNERGVSTVSVGRRTWTITPALGLWMPAGVAHSGSAPAGTWYRTTHFEIGLVDDAPAAPVAVDIGPLLRLLLERLDDDTLSSTSRATTEAMVLDVLEPATNELLVHAPMSTLLAPIVEAVMAEPGDRRTLEEWADAVDVSSRTLTRAFRAETGQGFAQWQSAVRAQRAAHLLAAGVPVAEVVDEVGYATPSAFGAAFRRATGLTPREFRTRHV